MKSSKWDDIKKKKNKWKLTDEMIPTSRLPSSMMVLHNVSRVFPILTTVYFTLDFSALQISLTLLWLTFLKNTLFALVPPAGWILKCSENTTG